MVRAEVHMLDVADRLIDQLRYACVAERVDHTPRLTLTERKAIVPP